MIFEVIQVVLHPQNGVFNPCSHHGTTFSYPLLDVTFSSIFVKQLLSVCLGFLPSVMVVKANVK